MLKRKSKREPNVGLKGLFFHIGLWMHKVGSVLQFSHISGSVLLMIKNWQDCFVSALRSPSFLGPEPCVTKAFGPVFELGIVLNKGAC